MLSVLLHCDIVAEALFHLQGSGSLVDLGRID
jgi:hypothetical protein